MSAKFKKATINGAPAEWVIETTCESTGGKPTEVGDLIKINRKVVRVTEIVQTTGVPSTYGFKTVARFVNY